MFINPSSDIDVHSNVDFECEEGMKNVDINRYNRLECPIFLKPEIATFDDVALHATIRQRLSIGTINRNLRYARFMENYTPRDFSVNFKKFNYENVIRHLDYREQIEGAGWGALKHEWQSIRMFVKAYGLNPNEWQYRPPKNPKYKTIPVMFPNDLHKILHIRYKKDYYKDSYIKHILTKNHFIGWRFPSEPSILKTDDVDLENHTILITSPKLNNATRLLNIEELEKRKSSYSFKNYLDKIRPRFTSQYSKDYVFINPNNGKPFTGEDQLRMWMNRHANNKIKQICKKYYNYTCRHWCAIARLIRTKIESKHYDPYEVKEWMGHTKIQTTMDYVKHAKFYYEKTGFDWIKRVLKNHKKSVEENSLKTQKPCFRAVGFQITRREDERRLPTARTTDRRKKILNILKKYVPVYQSKTFLFSFHMGVAS